MKCKSVKWTHRRYRILEQHQVEVEMEVVLKKSQGNSAKSAPMCECQQDKIRVGNWHTYLNG
jgi:hypothetical protein